MGKRENNKTIVRNRLLAEARRLFAKKGFEQTTISDLVQATGIAKGTFYNYFPDSKELFAALLDQLNNEFLVIVKEARKEATTIYGFLYLSFKSYFDYISNEEMIDFHQKNQGYIRNVSFGRVSRNNIAEDLLNDLKSSKLNIKLNKKQEMQLLSLLLIGSASEMFLNIQSRDIKISNDELAGFLASLFCEGIAQ